MRVKNCDISRRDALSSSTWLIAGLLSGNLLASPTTPDLGRLENDSAAELYVFPGGGAETTVVAITWPTKPPASRIIDPDAPYVKVHSGTMTWKVDINAERNLYKRYDSGCRIYVGRVHVLNTSDDGKIEAVVIEARNHLFERNSLPDMGEHVAIQGNRQRVGSPFLANILAENKKPNMLYHTSSPKQDQALLLPQIASEIATRARFAGHLNDPQVYGHRIASLLLPNLLRYDPKLPPGFTFAAQNGRHPADDASASVHMILSGVPATSNLHNPLAIQKEFSYLGTLSAEQALYSAA